MTTWFSPVSRSIQLLDIGLVRWLSERYIHGRACVIFSLNAKVCHISRVIFQRKRERTALIFTRLQPAQRHLNYMNQWLTYFNRDTSPRSRLRFFIAKVALWTLQWYLRWSFSPTKIDYALWVTEHKTLFKPPPTQFTTAIFWWVRMTCNHVFRGGPKYTIISLSGRGMSLV